MQPLFYLLHFICFLDITGITVHVEGKKPVLFDPESDLTVQEAEDQIREMYGLVGGAITGNGLACERDQPLRTYQGEDLKFDDFESAAKEGKSTILSSNQLSCLNEAVDVLFVKLDLYFL